MTKNWTHARKHPTLNYSVLLFLRESEEEMCYFPVVA